MQLQELIASLDDLDDELFICAVPPWTPQAEARLVMPDDRLAVPDDIKQAGFTYFLEEVLAKELVQYLERNDTPERRLALVMHYAENDAAPDWLTEARTPPDRVR